MPTYPAANYSPLTGPTTSGTTYTVDYLLRNPTRVNAVVADLTMSNYFLDQVFATPGGVTGGAVLYDVVDQNLTYTERDVEVIAPGTEAPVVTRVRVAPRTKQVVKLGGKFPTTQEARDRNDQAAFNGDLAALANTISRKMNQRGMAELAAAITEFGRTAAGISWSAAMALTGTTQSPGALPARNLAAVNRAMANLEMGYQYDTLIINPQEAESLDVVYGDRLNAVFGRYGINNIISTPRKAAGSAYFLQAGRVGELRLERPLRTTVADRLAAAPDMVEETWTQTLINPVMYVTNPFAIIEITGIA